MKKLYMRSLVSLLICTAATIVIFCIMKKMTLALGIGFAVGTIAACIAQGLFFKAWKSAPDGASVALYYGMRVALILLSIFITLAVSRPAALGAIIPHIFSTPIIAAVMALSKE